MKKLSVFLTLILFISLPAACGSALVSSESLELSQSAAGSIQTNILYAVFSAEDIEGYPIEYTGTQETVEELVNELNELAGLDFIIAVSRTENSWIVDQVADSTLVVGLDNREQKEEFHFFDTDSLRWFMMDSLRYIPTESYGVESIYYTMDDDRELFFEEGMALSPVNVFPFDILYMRLGLCFVHAGVRGDDETPYARIRGLWRMDGVTDTVGIKIDGSGGFTMYYVSKLAETLGYLRCVEGYENGDFRYDIYAVKGALVVSFYFGSDTQFHVGNDDGSVYLLDTRATYQDFWEYPDGATLKINEERWNLYAADGFIPFTGGPVEYDGGIIYLMSEDGSSDGKIYSDENDNLIDTSGDVLTHLGMSIEG